MFFLDDCYLDRPKEFSTVQNFAGTVVTSAARGLHYPDRIKTLRFCGGRGLHERRDTISASFTVLHGALNFAKHLAPRRIVILGADMGYEPGGKTHYHDERKVPPPMKNYDGMINALASTFNPLLAAGILVVNSTLGGRLEVFPRVPWEETQKW
jgi:hypothetical protein